MSFISDMNAYRRFQALPPERRKIVFYSEGKAYWPHLGPLARELTGPLATRIAYVSSSPDDPGLSFNPQMTDVFCIGSGWWRTLWFQGLDCGVCVMTMPDLESFHLKRSRGANVRYAYVFHSPVSTHMIYRGAAFDHYDAIFCVGPHHGREIRRREETCNLPAKQLLPHGYGRLDELLLSARPSPAMRRGGKTVVIAPSWSEKGIVESGIGRELIMLFLSAGFRVSLRPHPRTVQLQNGLIRKLVGEFSGADAFSLDTEPASMDFLLRSDLLVSDWSGVAYEYAFAALRPVLFVDTPRKVNNPEYGRLGIVPMEVEVREKVGMVLRPDNLETAPEMAERLMRDPAFSPASLEQLRGDYIYNVGASARVGAEMLLSLAV